MNNEQTFYINGSASEPVEIVDQPEHSGPFNYVFAHVLYNNQSQLFRYSEPYSLHQDDPIIVNTQYGEELAIVLGYSVPLSPKILESITFNVLREAKKSEVDTFEMFQKKSLESFHIAKEKITKHELPIRLINVHHFLDGKKVLFNFYSDNRVDFRALVRDLANIFKARIELRQIGIRDVSCLLSGYGVCGREFCCHLMHTHKGSVSIKQAKQLNLNLSSYKISGVCGRLMCCLDFEKCDDAAKEHHSHHEHCSVLRDYDDPPITDDEDHRYSYHHPMLYSNNSKSAVNRHHVVVQESLELPIIKKFEYKS